jgi:hypothetical protein
LRGCCWHCLWVWRSNIWVVYLSAGGLCHPQVALQHAQELARYARLASACDALESFLGGDSVALSEWHGVLKGLLRREFGDVDWVEFYGRRMEAVAPDESDDS